MEFLQAEVLLQGLPWPTLILSSKRTVLAANDAVERLTGLSTTPAVNNSIIGCSLTDLGLVLIPSRQPILPEWNSLFDASLNQFESLQKDKRDRDIRRKSMPSKDFLAEDDSDDSVFWDHYEDSTFPTLDVMIPKIRSISTSGVVKDGRQVRAKMLVQTTGTVEGLFYIITFQPPSPKDTITTIPAAEREAFLRTQPYGSNILPNSNGSDVGVHSVFSSLIPHVMALLSTQGQVLFLSKSWYEFTGMTEAQSLGTGWAEAIHPDDVEEISASWGAVLRGDSLNWNWEARYRKRDGSYRYFLIRAQPYKDSSGEIRQWYASMLDINELVLARLESEHRRRTIEMLLSQADVSLWGINKSRELYIRAGTLSWDPTSPNAPEQDMEVNMSTVSDSDVAKVLDDIFDGEEFPSTLEHQDGDRSYRTRFMANIEDHSTASVKQPKTTTVLGLTIEITDVKVRAKLKIDNERLLANERAAIEASQLKSRFLANMSHEIRTPIAGVVGMNNLLFDSGLNAQQKELSLGIQQSSAFLLALVNDILDFSKIEAGHMDIEEVEFRPSTIIDGVHRLMSFQAERKNLPLKYHNELPEDVMVIGDPQRLQQVLMNLIGNSIKFTNNGAITLTMRLATQGGILQSEAKDKKSVNASGLRPHAPGSAAKSSGVIRLEFIVEDTGCGIEEATMLKLFHPFSQADSSTARRHGGSGLGLTISKQLVELMDGHIDLKSVSKVGSVATVSIPYHRVVEPQVMDDKRPSLTERSPSFPKGVKRRASAATSMKGTEDAMFKISSEYHSIHPTDMSMKSTLSNVHRASIRVLVVEDNPVNQKIAILLIRKLGFTANAVSNGEEALEYLSSSPSDAAKPRPDIILMDCMMPIMDGYEASWTLRHDTNNRFSPEVRQTPIIAVTASAIRGEREKCELAGMDDFLSKPIIKDELEKLLLRWSSQGRNPGPDEMVS